MPKKKWKPDVVKRLQKTMAYSRIRQYFPMPEPHYVDDHDSIDDAEVVHMDWLEDITKPVVGIVKDFEAFPRWTKYCRFLRNNDFVFDIYNLHSNDWINEAKKFDLIVGIVSSEPYQLLEMREKYYFLEAYLGKHCFPNTADIWLYENKSLEAVVSQIFEIPYAKTYVSYNKDDALAIMERLSYPFISKVNPSSGSMAVELVQSPKEAARIINQAFSRNGRRTHVNYFRQKHYIYFQEFIPNDGYDIRIILVGNWAFGYYRKVLSGDFRASGMGLVEKRELPQEAIRVAWETNKHLRSPLLVVDMVHGEDGRYTIIEFSPVCQMETPEQLHVNGIPGVYIIEDSGQIHFAEGRYWVHELALREFLKTNYLHNKK